MNLRINILALIIAFFACGAAPAMAGDKIKVSFYLAQNETPSAKATLAPERLDLRLQSVFGFNYYVLLKSQEIDMNHEWQQWAVPRKDFFIRIEPLPRQSGSPKMVYYEIYKDGLIVAKGKYEPRYDTPLFINGPDFKQGRFIFVLEAR